MSMKISVSLDSFNKIFKVGDIISGTVEVTSSQDSEYDSISCVIRGDYTIKTSKTSQPLIQTFYTKKQKISEKGKIKSNAVTKLPLKLYLTSSNDNELIESYQGVIVSISYELSILYNDVKMSDNIKVYIFYPGQGVKTQLKQKIIPYDFTITESSIEKVKIENGKIPKFKLICHIDSLNVDIGKELNGWIKVINCDLPIKSLELQFVRIEKVTLPNDDVINEVSEIQNLQIGDGEVLLDNEISLNMLFPRHFCCASIENNVVKLNFDINIILVLSNGFIITENVPLNCYRG